MYLISFCLPIIFPFTFPLSTFIVDYQTLAPSVMIGNDNLEKEGFSNKLCANLHYTFNNIVPTADKKPMKVRQLLIGILNENYLIKQKEFKVSEDYLASNVMEFLKQFLRLKSTMTSSDLFGKIFPTVPESQKEGLCAFLDNPSVQRMIRKVSRKDKLFIKLSSQSNFHTSRCHDLFAKLVSKNCKPYMEILRLDESKEYIISIMQNIKLHDVAKLHNARSDSV